jgi:DNA-binding Lrp family transcriptional regulator
MGAEEEVLQALTNVPEVKEAYLVYGVYDVLAYLETDTMEEMKNVISFRIRRIDKIRSTMSLIEI